MNVQAQAIINILNNDFNTNISADYYTRIELWRQWWAGYVKAFHTYKELQDNGTHKMRDLYSFRMAKKICEDWASILLNEKTEIVIEDNASSVFLQGDDGTGGVFSAINFWEEANTLVEKAFYSGTGAFLLKLDGLTAASDGAVIQSPDGRIRMEYLPAFCIVPLSQRYGAITEAAFISERTERGKSFVYVEIHTQDESGNYTIENRYYSNEGGALKQTALPAGVAEKFNTGSPIPFFAIIHPNTVNPYPNNLGLGCAIFSEAIDNLKGVDLAFNNFCRDFRLGGKKVFYNRELTKQVGVTADGSPIYIAPDDMMQQLFVSIGDPISDDGRNLVHEFNPALRVADNKDGVQAQLDYLSFKCGLGARHYRFDGAQAPITATQYMGEKQELKQNAAKHGIVVEKALRDITRAMLWAAKNILAQAVNPDANINVVFSDGYIVSDEEKRLQDIQDVRDGIMQKWEYRVKWYGEDEKTAKANTEMPNPIFGNADFPPGEDDT